ncbi:MAG: flagellar type III secretion system protein FliR [Pseudomonadales bacterium]|nr:flagellar type III secretion system protein FliR [Pseudomonadales bacterium]
MNINEAQMMLWLSNFLWPFIRISGFFLVMPVIGSRLVSPYVRAGLVTLITFTVMPTLPPMPQVDLLSVQTYVIAAEQLVIGISMAFLIQILFQIFILAGQMIAMQMGLGFASMVDPANGVTVAIISQFYLMLTTLVFMAMNGHLVAIEVLVESFRILPVSAEWQFNGIYHIAASGSWLFASALFVALPAVTAILIINFAFGIMTRAAPQLNVFSLGFPFTMLMGLIILWLGLSGFLPQYNTLVSECLSLLKNIYTLKP